MKIMRYRIRVIVFLLILSLLAVLLWSVRAAWQPFVPVPFVAESTPSAFPVPESTETPVTETVSPGGESSVPAETPTVPPLYDTFGL